MIPHRGWSDSLEMLDCREPYSSWAAQEEWKRLAEALGAMMAPSLSEDVIAKACYEDGISREEVINLYEDKCGRDFFATVIHDPTTRQVKVAWAWWGMLLEERSHQMAKLCGYAEEDE